MSDHVTREFQALLRSARTEATTTTRNRLRRLRTLDAKQVVPGAEIDRIEFILAAREMRTAEARGFAMTLMGNHGISASVLARFCDFAWRPARSISGCCESCGIMTPLLIAHCIVQPPSTTTVCPVM